MAWSNLANLFRGSSHDFCQLYYNIKQIDFIFLCFCTVIDHRWRHSVWRTKSHALDCVSCVLFCSSHAMTSSVIYYNTDARKNEIYLLSSDQISWFSEATELYMLHMQRIVQNLGRFGSSCLESWEVARGRSKWGGEASEGGGQVRGQSNDWAKLGRKEIDQFVNLWTMLYHVKNILAENFKDHVKSILCIFWGGSGIDFA